MNASLPSALIHALGFIGLIAVGIIPVRSWFVLQRAFKGIYGASKFGKLLTTPLVLMVVATLWSDLQITTRIFKCLAETYCGPGIASGWTYLVPVLKRTLFLVYSAGG